MGRSERAGISGIQELPEAQEEAGKAGLSAFRGKAGRTLKAQKPEKKLEKRALSSRKADGTVELLGATQGYDENGFSIRGAIPLEAGMTILPLFTAVSADGTEREYEGESITVPEGGLTLQWSRIPAGEYAYCFGLTDLSGQVHYTDSVDISF